MPAVIMTRNGPSRQSTQLGSPLQKGSLPKDALARIAEESLKAIEAGSYSLPRLPQAALGGAAESFDLRDNVARLQERTTYFGPDSDLASWARPPILRSRSLPSRTEQTKIWTVKKSSLETSRWLAGKLATEPPDQIGSPGGGQNPGPRTRAVGVLTFASARTPGGGFLTGAQAQEESIVRSSTLYFGLTSPSGQQFYTYHNSLAKGDNDGYYSHAMIYNPSVMVFRDETGGWIRPFEIDVVTASAVNAGVVRRKRQLAIDRGEEVTCSEEEMERSIRAAMKERMARILYLFETRGVKNLVLGSFGTGAFKNKQEMVVEIWAELLLNKGARFGRSFDRIVFGENNITYVKLSEKFGAGP